MSLFYKEEHSTCYNYRMPSLANFKVIRYSAGEEATNLNVDRSVLVFLLRGSVYINCNPHDELLHQAGDVLLYPRGSEFTFRVEEDCLGVSCAFVPGLRLCNHVSFEKLKEHLPCGYTYNFHPLPVRERIREFLDLAVHCLDDGLGCSHFHEMLENQLFILLRAYYAKEELAMFFHPLLCNNLDFKDFILGHYTDSFNNSLLAEKLNMSLKTYNRHFERAFGESAHQWMNQKKAEFVYRDLTLTNKTVAEIAIEYNFSSSNYLIAFCKKAFGQTPLDIRRQNTASLQKNE